MDYRLVDGPAWSAEASTLLALSWRPPAVLYSPKYLNWQLSFPGPWPAPAVVALDKDKVAGFAATMHRRIRHKDLLRDALLVSFVAVHPDCRNMGVAAELYAHLLDATRKYDAPLITFGQNGSAGQRCIDRAYPAAGFCLQSLGDFPVLSCMARPATTPSAWMPGGYDELQAAIEHCCTRQNFVWSHPTPEQFEHYLKDPRGRRLLACYNPDKTIAGAAWIARVEYINGGQINHVTTVDSVWLRSEQSDLLPSLVSSAGQVFPDKIVNAPSLAMFDSQQVRQQGFRQTSAAFRGYGASASAGPPFADATGSNMEVV